LPVALLAGFQYVTAGPVVMCRNRVFVTNMKHAIAMLAWFYNQRAGAENLIKEANSEAELAAHPSAR